MKDTKINRKKWKNFSFTYISLDFQILTQTKLYSFLLLILVACPLWGQVKSKKKLNPEDYHRWSTLISPQISNNGKWVSYLKQFDYGQDTLFIQSTNENAQYIFPGKARLKFSMDGKKAIIQIDSLLQIQDLGTGDLEDIYPIIKYELTPDDKYLLIQKTNEFYSDKILVIKELKNGKEHVLKGVERHVMNSSGTSLLYTVLNRGKYSLYLINLTNKQLESRLVRESNFPFKRLTWGPSGISFAFLQAESSENDDLTINFCKDYYKSQWYRMNPIEMNLGVDRLELSDTQLIISKDDQKIFFKGISTIENSEINKRTEDKIVEIWHSRNNLIQPREKVLGLDQEKPLMWVWWPNSNRTMQLGKFEQPYVVITPNFDYTISYNLWDNEPQFKRDADLNLYITELVTGKKQLLVDNLTYQVKYFTMSKDGHYLKYFKQGDWWVYNIEKQKHINLTKRLGLELTELDFDNPDSVIAYGSPGWSDDEKSIFVYDKYDIWQISLDGLKEKRLTRGREKAIKFRIYERATSIPSIPLFSPFMDSTYDVKSGLVLEAKGDDLNTGFYFWEPNGGAQPIVYKPKNIYNIKKAKKSMDYIYLEETFEQPTQLVYESQGFMPKTLAEPNFFQRNYAWGSSSLISYKNKEGDKLFGVLIYPAGFVPGKKYPLVVSIYEEQQHKLYEAVVPSEYIRYDYLNPTIFTSNDYFVLYPDIHYNLGKPGASALDCVGSAVNRVIDMGFVDSDRIGLFGVSFGGFETVYIISKTDMFATAIAGAPITDFVSSYLSINETIGLDDAWRYEHHQLRMGNSFEVDFDGFINNSPIHNVHEINTPLLGWVGNDDTTVNWTQSVELYLALRRLQKEYVLLVYPNEKHAILNKQKQKDLTTRIGEWMGHFLQEYPKKKWMMKSQIN